VKSFVISGSGETPEGQASYEEGAIRRGETSPEAMREKACFVLGVMESRMAALGVGWAEASATQLYTVYDIHPFLADEIVSRGEQTTVGSPGTTLAPRSKDSISRWMCAVFRLSGCYSWKQKQQPSHVGHTEQTAEYYQTFSVSVCLKSF